MSWHHDRLRSELHKHAAAFLSQLAFAPGQMLTITDVGLAADNRRATIHLSVWPKGGEGLAWRQSERHHRDLVEYLKKKIMTRDLPQIELVLDH